MVLVNARSVSNKAFILNDLFTSHKLDFLFTTETWIGAGVSSIFGELCPLNCGFISALQDVLEKEVEWLWFSGTGFNLGLSLLGTFLLLNLNVF